MNPAWRMMLRESWFMPFDSSVIPQSMTDHARSTNRHGWIIRDGLITD